MPTCNITTICSSLLRSGEHSQQVRQMHDHLLLQAAEVPEFWHGSCRAEWRWICYEPDTLRGEAARQCDWRRGGRDQWEHDPDTGTCHQLPRSSPSRTMGQRMPLETVPTFLSIMIPHFSGHKAPDRIKTTHFFIPQMQLFFNHYFQLFSIYSNLCTNLQKVFVPTERYNTHTICFFCFVCYNGTENQEKERLS